MNKKLLSLCVLAVGLLLPCFSRAAAPEIRPQTGDKIAFLGDSITYFGYATKVNLGYVALVKRGLAKNGADISVVGAGVIGDTSEDMLKRLNKVLAQKPKYLTLSCGMNDCNCYKDASKWLTAEQFRANVETIVTNCIAAGVTPILLTPSMAMDDLRYNDDPATDAIPGNIRNAQRANHTQATVYIPVLRALAEQYHLALAEIRKDLWTKRAEPGVKTVLGGDIHPNDLGHETMARTVLRLFGVPDSVIDETIVEAEAAEKAKAK